MVSEPSSSQPLIHTVDSLGKIAKLTSIGMKDDPTRIGPRLVKGKFRVCNSGTSGMERSHDAGCRRRHERARDLRRREAVL